MPDAPWTKLPRGCADLAASIGLDRYGAWCWLLSHAAYADTPDPAWGTLREGEVAVSTRRLAEAWGVGRHAVCNILSDLVEAGLAEVVRKAVGASGGQVLRINQGTFSGTFSGTFLKTSNKGLTPMTKNRQGTFSGTFPGRAPARTILPPRELYRNNGTDRTAYRFSGDYSGVQTAPEILALGQRKEGE